MTVWVPHEINTRTVDLSAATKFGQLKFVNRTYIYGDKLIRDPFLPGNTLPVGFALGMNKAVMEFDPLQDYLMMAGDHLQLLALTAMLTHEYLSFQVLRYDRTIQDYIPVWLHSGIADYTGDVLKSPLDYIGDNSDEDGSEGGNPRQR